MPDFLVVSAEDHHRLVAAAYRARGFTDSESEDAARFFERIEGSRAHHSEPDALYLNIDTLLVHDKLKGLLYIVLWPREEKNEHTFRANQLKCALEKLRALPEAPPLDTELMRCSSRR